MLHRRTWLENEYDYELDRDIVLRLGVDIVAWLRLLVRIQRAYLVTFIIHSPLYYLH